MIIFLSIAMAIEDVILRQITPAHTGILKGFSLTAGILAMPVLALVPSVVRVRFEIKSGVSAHSSAL